MYVVMVIYYISEGFDNEKSNIVLVVQVRWSAAPISREIWNEKRFVPKEWYDRSPPNITWSTWIRAT